MAASQVTKEQKHFRGVSAFFRNASKASLFWLLLNTIAPLVVAIFVIRGGQEIVDSRRVAEEALRQRQEALEELRAARAERDQAVSARQKVEQETQTLLQEQNRIREDNARLSEEPLEVIDRIRRELGGKSPEVRADSLYKRGRDAFAEGNLKLAHALYMASLEEDERYPWALIGLGNIASRQKEYHVAEKHFERAIAAAPQNKIAVYNLGSVSVYLKKWDQARTYLNRTLELDASFEPAKKLLEQVSQQR
jgi:tetratricopeptide (TPR) repeat protein